MIWRCSAWLSSFRCCRALRRLDTSSETDIIRSMTSCHSLSAAVGWRSGRRARPGPWTTAFDPGDGQLSLRQAGVHEAGRTFARSVGPELPTSAVSCRPDLGSLTTDEVIFELNLISELSRSLETLLAISSDDDDEACIISGSSRRTDVSSR